MTFGRVDVDAFLEEIPASLLAEWQAYYAIEPWGEERADLRNAMAMQLTANINRKQGATPFRVADFMPYAEQRESETKPRRAPDLEARLKNALKPPRRSS